MAKLTTQIIEDLYSYGKSVYDRKIGFSKLLYWALQ